MIDPYKIRNTLYGGLTAVDVPEISPLSLVIDSIIHSQTDMNATLESQLAKANISLARDRTELFANLQDRDEQFLFSTPAKTEFTMRVGLLDVIAFGVLDVTGNIYKFTVPKNTYIKIDDVYFTLLYDVTVSVNKANNFSTFVSYDIVDSTIVFGDEGVVPSGIVTDNDNVQWVVFNIQTAQLQVAQYLSTSVAGVPYQVDQDISDSYFYSYVELQDNLNVWHKVEKHYIETIYDSSVPTIFTQIGDKVVRYKIPSVFVDNNSLTGNLRTTIYTTKGKIKINMAEYKQKDFKLFLNKNRSDVLAVATSNMDVLVSNTSLVDGGTLPATFRDIKKRLVNRTTSRIDVPITESQVYERIRREGMRGYLVKDTILSRVYLAKQELFVKKEDSAFITAYQDTISFKDYTDLQPTIKYTGTFFSCRPGTIFKSEKGSITPLTNTELVALKALAHVDYVEILNKSTYLSSVFTHIIDISQTNTKARVYDIAPSIPSSHINSKNATTGINVNVSSYALTYDKSVFTLKISLAGNDSYTAIANSVRVQLKIKTRNDFLYYHSTIVSGTHEIKINVSDYISSDDYLLATNGATPLVNREFKINGDMGITLYTTDTGTYNGSSVTDKSFLGVNNADIYVDGTAQSVLGLTKEVATTIFAKNVKYLWRESRAYSIEKEYARYAVNIPLTYPADVYQTDPNTGCAIVVTPCTAGGTVSITKTLLHSAGSNVLDGGGNIQYKHKIGDLILTNGQPTETGNVKTNVITDILTVDHKYTFSDNVVSKAQYGELGSLLDNILYSKMKTINSTLIDNSTAYFKSKISIGKVYTTDGDSYGNSIKPVITLYFDKAVKRSPLDKSTTNVLIGNIIRRFISKSFFSINDMEKEIGANIPATLSVGITKFTDDNRKLFSIDERNTFVLSTYIDNIDRVLYNITIVEKEI